MLSVRNSNQNKKPAKESVARVAQYLSYLAALILALMPFHEFLAVWLGSSVGHLDLVRIWKEILICLMLPPSLWLAWKQPKIKSWLLNSWLLRLYIFYVVIHLSLGLWALHGGKVSGSALIYGLIVNLRYVAFFFVCAISAASLSFLRDNWPKILLGPALVAIIFGLMQKLILPLNFLSHFGYGPKTIPAYETVDNNIHYVRVGSTLRGANPFGAYLVLVISAGVNYLRTTSVVKPLYLLASVAALFFTYSRSAWVGAALSLLALAFIGRQKIGPRLMTFIVAIVVLAAGGAFIFRSHQSVQDALLHTSQHSTSKLTSNGARSSALKNGARDIIHQPLGGGPGTAGPASVRNTGHPARIAENYYLQIGQEVGVIGLAIFLAMNILVVLELWGRRSDMLAQILLASLIGISFINLLSHAWADDSLSLLWWGLAGIACAPVILKSKFNPNENQKT